MKNKIISIFLILLICLSTVTSCSKSMDINDESNNSGENFGSAESEENTMKMILGILNTDDAPVVIQHLNKAGYFVTRLTTSGGFLRAGNATILVGVEDEKVQPVIDIIHQYSRSRKQLMPTTSEAGIGFFPTMPVEVQVGGATIFVLDVNHFEKF